MGGGVVNKWGVVGGLTTLKTIKGTKKSVN